GRVGAYRPPEELGFSEMHGRSFGGPGDVYISRVPLALRPDGLERAEGVGVRPDPFRADDHRMAQALEFLDRASELDRPWTMEVNLATPHFPHHVTQQLWDQHAGHDDLPEHGADAAPAHHPYARDLRRHFGFGAFTEQRTRAHRRAYYGRVSYVDAQLGLLLDKLKETGQAERTVVAYTSDHGEMLGQFGMWFKCSMYEESARVPLIAAGPGFSPGTRTRTPVTQWDLGAAIFAAVGVRRPGEMAGQPLQQVAPDDPDRVVFSEYHGHGVRGSAFMVRQGRWKLIYNAKASHQLYDLEADPYELRNLAESDQPAVRRLTERLHDEFCDPELEQKRAEAFIQRQLAALESGVQSERGISPGGGVSSPLDGDQRDVP
ncbi:MAG: sulfatase-like hydrolase/transferase, partial [Micromonosporaceae bacterium]